MKTIICLWGNAGIGKTSAIQAIYKKLNIEDNPPMSRFGDDFLAIVPFCNSKVGLASMGDPNSELEFTSIDRCLRKIKRKSVSLLQSCLKAGLLQPLKIA